jgi:AraC-like DNA-binding protein
MRVPMKPAKSRPEKGAILEGTEDHARSAWFSSPSERYHADRCEALRAAVRRGEVRLAALVRRGYPGRLMPAGMLPEVSTVGFWDAVGPQNWGLDWHRNEGIELTYLARGWTGFHVDHERFRLESQHLTITRPWQSHRVGDPHIGPSRLCWLILDVGVRRPDQPWRWPDWLILSPSDLGRLTTLLRHNEHPVWHANDEIAACFERLAALVRTPDPLSMQTRLRLHINELLVALRELLEEKEIELDAKLVSRRRTVELFLAGLPQHLENAWTLDQMAYQCGLGASAFTTHCKQITNLSPAKYLIHCRIEAAKRMLATQPEVSITDVAFACGFETSQYFATVFAKVAGTSPSAFRAQTQARTANRQR